MMKQGAPGLVARACQRVKYATAKPMPAARRLFSIHFVRNCGRIRPSISRPRNCGGWARKFFQHFSVRVHSAFISLNAG
jgi:hypothetical protein